MGKTALQMDTLRMAVVQVEAAGHSKAHLRRPVGASLHLQGIAELHGAQRMALVGAGLGALVAALVRAARLGGVAQVRLEVAQTRPKLGQAPTREVRGGTLQVEPVPEAQDGALAGLRLERTLLVGARARVLRLVADRGRRVGGTVPRVALADTRVRRSSRSREDGMYEHPLCILWQSVLSLVECNKSTMTIGRSSTQRSDTASGTIYSATIRRSV